MRSFFLLFTLLLFGAHAWASSLVGNIDSVVESAAEEKSEPVSRDLIEFESGYVFESDLHRGGSFGNQYEVQNSFSYAHRFLLTGHVYLHLGVDYSRFDFGATAAPVPRHLHSMAGVIGIDYMHNNDVGAFFQIKPGFYGEDDFNSSAFDAPITLGRIFVLEQDKLYLFVGANAAFLRGRFPVVPILGLVWMPNAKWKVLGVLPEPRVIYSPNGKWDFWVGGELGGGSFRTNKDSAIAPSQLSGAQVDYSDYRVGGGLIYSPCDAICIDLGGGCAIQRRFDFYRADIKYKTDAAPYLRVEFKAKF